MPKKTEPGGGGGKPDKVTTIEGDETADLFLPGTSGDDIINANGGDDSILASLGSDTIDGGDGSDLLVYDLLFPADDTDGDGLADFSVSRIQKGKNVTYEVSYTVDGVTQTDTVKNVEFIAFSDGSLLDTVNNVLTPGTPPPPPPPAPGTITFDDATAVDYASTGGQTFNAYRSGTDDAFVATQQTSATNGYEDAAPLLNYDGADDDFEFVVSTEADGTTHELAVIRDDNSPGSISSFSVESLVLSGLEAGEEVTIFTSLGSVFGSEITLVAGDTVDNGTLDLNQFSNLSQSDPLFLYTDGILQISVVAGSGDTFFVDDILVG